MLPIHTILHPTDFSPRARHAFRLACALARDYGAHLLVLHVVPAPLAMSLEGVVVEPPESFRDEVLAQLRTLRPDEPAVQTEYETREGDAVHEIVQFAADRACDLIVLGTHGRTGLRRLLMGSVAEGVLRRAGCPVLTVKTPLPTAHPAAAQEAQLALHAPHG
jgi:nucleotide-binding universal stress UspA family protein